VILTFYEFWLFNNYYFLRNFHIELRDL